MLPTTHGTWRAALVMGSGSLASYEKHNHSGGHFTRRARVGLSNYTYRGFAYIGRSDYKFEEIRECLKTLVSFDYLLLYLL